MSRFDRFAILNVRPICSPAFMNICDQSYMVWPGGHGAIIRGKLDIHLKGVNVAARFGATTGY